MTQGRGSCGGGPVPTIGRVHRRLLLPLAAAVLAGLLASGCGKQSAAVRVGDESVSQQELFDELHLIVTNDQFRSITFGSEEEQPLSQLQGSLGPRSYSQFMIGAVVQQRVTYLVAGDVLAANDIEITDEDRAGIEAAIDQALDEGKESLPPAYLEDLVEGQARLMVLQQELDQDELQRQMSDAAARADIEISSHFGSWDEARLRVVPPPGPIRAPGSGGGNGSGAGSGSA